MATSQDSLAWRRRFCRGQWKEQEGEEDRKRDGKITSRNGQEWGLEIPWEQRKTGKGRKVLLRRHLWCPDDLQGYGTEMRWDEMKWKSRVIWKSGVTCVSFRNHNFLWRQLVWNFMCTICTPVWFRTRGANCLAKWTVFKKLHPVANLHPGEMFYICGANFTELYFGHMNTTFRQTCWFWKIFIWESKFDFLTFIGW